jgi:hypothetical protein
MSTEKSTSRAAPAEIKSRTPCIILPIVGLFVVLLCYVTIVVVRNISPTSIRQFEERRATATAFSSTNADAGATVAAELASEATQTALAAPSADSTPGELLSPTEMPGPESTQTAQESSASPTAIPTP